MAQEKNKHEALLQELIAKAKQRNIEVRTEKLIREVGYHARSGRCRLKEHELIILDRDAPIRDHVDFLAEELKAEGSITGEFPLPVRKPVRPRHS